LAEEQNEKNFEIIKLANEQIGEIEAKLLKLNKQQNQSNITSVFRPS
jgi:hypothetical protein